MRTVKAALLCGVLAASVAVFLFSLGVFAPWSGPFTPAAGEGSRALPPGVQWAGAALLGFGLAWTTVRIRAFSLKAVVAVVALLETVLLSWILFLFDILWMPWTALAAGLFGTVFGFLYSRSAPGRRLRALETVLGGRASEASLKKWLDSDEPLPFGGCEREASVLVCRVFNRAQWEKTLPAGESAAFASGLIQACSKWIKDSGAALIESDGEHWVAVFGAVLPEADHEIAACRAALNLRDEMTVLDLAFRERWGPGLDFGIAVHSGTVSAGVTGNQFFVTGEPVDFARALCEAAHGYGVRILAGPRTAARAWATVETRPVELIRNRAGGTWEEIYELLALKGGLTVEEEARRRIFWKGVIHGRRGEWSRAARQFEIVLRDAPAGDRLAGFYLARAVRGGGKPLIGDRFDETR